MMLTKLSKAVAGLAVLCAVGFGGGLREPFDLTAAHVSMMPEGQRLARMSCKACHISAAEAKRSALAGAHALVRNSASSGLKS